jgi:SAM-dependent methyltransferase
MVLVNDFIGEESIKKAIRQYDTKQKAKRFSSTVAGTATDRREKKCVRRALVLAKVPRRASVLDLPCGAGRLIPLLKRLGYNVTAADVSPHMLAQAQYYAGPFGENCIDDTDDFQLANVFETGFHDNCFDAVVCHRLLQYFPEPELRQKVLRELRRICSGPIVVSFLCDLAIDHAWDYALNAIRRRKPRGCIPISYKVLVEDARKAGLLVKKWIPMRPLISKRWYAILERDTPHKTGIINMSANNAIFWLKFISNFARVTGVAAVILIGFISLRVRAILDSHECEVERIAKEYQDGNNNFYVYANPHLEDLRTNKSLSIIGDLTMLPEKIATDRNQSKDSFFLISYKDLERIKETKLWAQLSLVRHVNVQGELFVLLSTEKSNTRIETKG